MSCQKNGELIPQRDWWNSTIATAFFSKILNNRWHSIVTEPIQIGERIFEIMIHFKTALESPMLTFSEICWGCFTSDWIKVGYHTLSFLYTTGFVIVNIAFTKSFDRTIATSFFAKNIKHNHYENDKTYL